MNVRPWMLLVACGSACTQRWMPSELGSLLPYVDRAADARQLLLADPHETHGSMCAASPAGKDGEGEAPVKKKVVYSRKKGPRKGPVSSISDVQSEAPSSALDEAQDQVGWPRIHCHRLWHAHRCSAGARRLMQCQSATVLMPNMLVLMLVTSVCALQDMAEATEAPLEPETPEAAPPGPPEPTPEVIAEEEAEESDGADWDALDLDEITLPGQKSAKELAAEKVRATAPVAMHSSIQRWSLPRLWIGGDRSR